jgi:hypothetical protein
VFNFSLLETTSPQCSIEIDDSLPQAFLWLVTLCLPLVLFTILGAVAGCSSGCQQRLRCCSCTTRVSAKAHQENLCSSVGAGGSIKKNCVCVYSPHFRRVSCCTAVAHVRGSGSVISTATQALNPLLDQLEVSMLCAMHDSCSVGCGISVLCVCYQYLYMPNSYVGCHGHRWWDLGKDILDDDRS